MFFKVSQFRKSLKINGNSELIFRYLNSPRFSPILHDFWLHFGSPGDHFGDILTSLGLCCGVWRAAVVACRFHVVLAGPGQD